MARIRSLKPEFWADRKLARQLPRDARLLYIGLWNLADEHSRLRGDPRYVQGQVFPYDDDLSTTDVTALLDAIVDAGRAVRYEDDSEAYLYLPKLAKHQRLEEKVPSRLPEPPPPGSDGNSSESRAEKSAPHADEYAQEPETASDLRTPIGSDESASRTDKSAADADESSLKQVAGSRLHVAGDPSLAGRDVVRATTPVPEIRGDVESICDRLAGWVETNTGKRPKVNKTWRDEARRLIDVDGYTVPQIERLMDWAHRDSFWSPIVSSMSKLRTHRDTLHAKAVGKPSGRVQTIHQQATEGLFGRSAVRQGVAP